MKTNMLDSGIRLLSLAGMLQCCRYIAASIYMGGGVSQSRELFESGLSYIGARLEILSAASALAGLVLTAIYIREYMDNRKGK